MLLMLCCVNWEEAAVVGSPHFATSLPTAACLIPPATRCCSVRFDTHGPGMLGGDTETVS